MRYPRRELHSVSGQEDREKSPLVNPLRNIEKNFRELAFTAHHSVIAHPHIHTQVLVPGSNFKLLELKPVLVLPRPLPPEDGGGLMEKFPFLNELSVLRRLGFGLRSQDSR